MLATFFVSLFLFFQRSGKKVKAILFLHSALFSPKFQKVQRDQAASKCRVVPPPFSFSSAPLYPSAATLPSRPWPRFRAAPRQGISSLMFGWHPAYLVRLETVHQETKDQITGW